MIKFTSKNIFIVTGASSGIGEGTALLLNEYGATVIAIARDKNRLELMKSKSKYPQNIHIEIKDLTEDIENLSKYIGELRNKYGKFQGMAHCAGVVDITPLQAVTYEHIKKIFDINYYVPIMLFKGFCDKRNNTMEKSSIVAVSSIEKTICDKGMLIYAGTKAALSSSAKVIAKEVANKNVRINTISPSHIESDMTKDKLNKIRKNYLETYKDIYPFGFGKPQDVANFIVFLLSDDAKWITRQDYIIDCGHI